MAKKVTTEDFIKRAIEVHGNQYDYSRTSIAGMDTKTIILCPIHGEFAQRPMDHVKGRGCSLCNEKQQLTYEQFVLKGSKKHANKYDYSGVNYINTYTKVSIKCKIHGTFSQTPKDHLNGCGCPMCGGKKKKTINTFVQMANMVHNNFYNYDYTDLKHMNSKVTITCSIHGNFEQRAADHINGSGCPECSLGDRGQYSQTYFDTYPHKKYTPAQLYLVQVDDLFCKVGITTQTISQRFGTSQVKKIANLYMPLFDAYNQEQVLFNKFKHFRYKASGLRSRKFAGWTECFPLSLLSDLEQEFVNIRTVLGS